MGVFGPLALVNGIGALLFNVEVLLRTTAAAAESRAGQEARWRVIDAWREVRAGTAAVSGVAADGSPEMTMATCPGRWSTTSYVRSTRESFSRSFVGSSASSAHTLSIFAIASR